jgi:peptidoglycan/xylan/chitin deacetylase (PgdA/CDA1 family)
MDILVTLDYELFLNDYVGTVQNSLINPSNIIIDICKRNNITMTVFVDAAYLYVLKEKMGTYPQLKIDYSMVEDNLKKMVDAGIDIQLHLHPQWYYCTYNGEQWIMDWDHYKLSDMPEDEAVKKFCDSKQILDEIVGYKTSAYRAGGYSLQDFNYKDCFITNGIKHDSSVLTGAHYKTKTHNYDYRGLPEVPYFFTNLLSPDIDGRFIEVPISTKQYNFFKYMKLKRERMKGITKNYGDGGDEKKRIYRDLIVKIIKAFGRPMRVSATFDFQTYKFLDEIIESYRQIGHATIISHPKNVSPGSLEYFESFVKKHLSQGDRFVSISDVIPTSN